MAWGTSWWRRATRKPGMVCTFLKSRWIFFFQAEDGIRDRDVTGVQTCALPISALRQLLSRLKKDDKVWLTDPDAILEAAGLKRSEEHTSELQSHHDLVCRL